MSFNDCIGDVKYIVGSCIVDVLIWVACLAYWEASFHEGVGIICRKHSYSVLGAS